MEVVNVIKKPESLTAVQVFYENVNDVALALGFDEYTLIVESKTKKVTRIRFGTSGYSTDYIMINVGDWIVTEGGKFRAVVDSDTFSREYAPDISVYEGEAKTGGN